MKPSSREQEVRDKIARGSQNPDDYLELLAILYDTGRDEEALSTVRNASTLPFSDLFRSVMLTALGWWVWSEEPDETEPERFGEQAMALVKGNETPEGLLAMAHAQGLVSQLVGNIDAERAHSLANSALSGYERLQGSRGRG